MSDILMFVKVMMLMFVLVMVFNNCCDNYTDYYHNHYNDDVCVEWYQSRGSLFRINYL